MSSTIIRHQSIENAVCALIDDLDQRVRTFESLLERQAEDGNTAFGKADTERLGIFCWIQFARLAAVIQVHHDVLDEAGRTSHLIQATETMDRICVCLDILKVLGALS